MAAQGLAEATASPPSGQDTSLHDLSLCQKIFMRVESVDRNTKERMECRTTPLRFGP